MAKTRRYYPGQLSIDFGEAGREMEEPQGVYETPSADPSRRLVFFSIGSGSSGNCAYLGNPEGGLLIDAGVAEDKVNRALEINGVHWKSVRGILLTHDHRDHMHYVYKLLRNNKHMRLFCTMRVLNGLLRRHGVSKLLKNYHTAIYKEIPFALAGFTVTAFDVPHDGTDNMGFNLEFDNRRFVIATDLGEVQDRARHYMSRADYLVIEANYDSEMLRLGRYPEYLKARIRAVNGHMDNAATAQFLGELAEGGIPKYVFLCHLSADNNTPEKALEAVRGVLTGKGLSVGDCSDSLATRDSQVQLMALPRLEPSRRFVFRP